MSDTEWKLKRSDGELLVRTGVAGRAAKMGHRLTLLMNSWDATVRWADDQPVAAHMTVDVDGLDVSHGEGGLMTLSGPEKSLARSHALKSLDAERFPTISFQRRRHRTDRRRLPAERHGGHSRHEPRCAVDLRVEDLGGAWRMSGESDVRQTEFGVKPYSMLMGAMKVADIVTVAFSAVRNDRPGR